MSLGVVQSTPHI